MTDVVRRREPNLPYGFVVREVRTVPRVARDRLADDGGGSAVVSQRARRSRRDGDAQRGGANERPDRADAARGLDVDARAARVHVPARRRAHAPIVSRSRRRRSTRNCAMLSRSRRSAASNISEGYELIEPRDLEARYLYRPATAKVRGVDVQVVPDLKVGYVMGIGDQVPIGLQQLGARYAAHRARSGHGGSRRSTTPS